MDNAFFRKVSYEFEGFKFLVRNLKGSHHMRPMLSSTHNSFVLTGLTKDRLDEVNQLHQSIREGRELNFWRKILYRFRGNRMCAVAINQTNQLVGFVYFYFREEEFSDKIIHEAFVGVAAEERGQGIATALLKYTIEQLSDLRLNGVSAYVEKNNTASVTVHQRNGFEIQEDPKDPENNFYLFYRLR